MSKEYNSKMHSVEHLLNQAMVRQFGCDRCFSAHINKKKSKCDYYFDRPLTESDILRVEKTVNQEIEKDHPVTVERLSREDARRLFDLKRVPKKDVLDEVRIVSIGDFDACPCIGSHVGSTREIGMFKITTTGFENGVLRIRFKLLP